MRKVLLLFFAVLLFASQGVEAQTSGEQVIGQGVDTRPNELRCKSDSPAEYKVGEICDSKSVTCPDGKPGYAFSRCNQAKECIGTESCGEPLPGTPDVPVETGGSGAPGGSAGSGSSGSGGGTSGSGGTLPSGNDPLGSFNPPSTPGATPLPGGSTDPSGGATINPDGSVMIPEIVTPQDAPPATTKPTNPAGEPSVLVPNRPSSTFGEGGVFSGGNPFEHLTTLGASNISGSVVSPVSSIFSGLLPSIINFFGNLFGVNSASRSSGGNGTASRPGTIVSANNPQTPTPQTPPLSGGPAQPVTDNPPNDVGNPIRPPYDVNPFPPKPEPPAEEILPSVYIVTAEMDTGTMSDASPRLPPYPSWWDEGTVLPNRFAEGLEQGIPVAQSLERARTLAVAGAFGGLAGGRIGANDPEVVTARRILEEDLAAAERARDFAYETCSLCFSAWVDKTFFSVTAEARAVDQARAELNLLAEAEGRARLGAYAGTLEPQIPGEIEFDEANAISVFGTGPGTLSGLVAERVRAALGFESRIPDAPALDNTNGLLAGLSSIAKNITGVVRSVAERFNFPGASQIEIPAQVAETPAPPTPPSAPPVPSTTETPETNPPKPKTPNTPNPTPAPTPTASPQSPQASPSNSGFAQAGMQMLSALIKALAAFFTPPGANSGTPSPAQTESRATPVATITANPNKVASGETTQLSWSSVGAGSCAIVDSLLAVIASGTSGKVKSSPLSETTRFGIICDIKEGEDKFINEVLVRVEGSASTTPPLFSNSGRASTAVSSSAAGGANTGGSSLAVPVDVRTCDPEQSIDSFIRCLCEAEPNPAGCSVPPGGV